MSETAPGSGVNRAKPYQLVLFPLNNGATNVYYVLVLCYIATFGANVLSLGTLFASVMVTAMRLCDAITDPIFGALMDRTNGKFGKFRPFMLIGNGIMAVSILALYGLTPFIPDTMMWARYAAFAALYWKKATKAGILAGMGAGFSVTIVWKLLGQPFGLGATVPGAIACVLALVLVSLATCKKHPSTFLDPREKAAA